MATSTPDLSAAGGPPRHVDPVTQTLALLQPWIDFVPRQQRRLGLFIFLALLLHVAAFFFIRIDTNRAELRHQTRLHVSVENPQALSLDGQVADPFWDRLTDPRVFLLPMTPGSDLTSGEPPLDFTAINPNIGTNALPPAAAPASYQATAPLVPPLEQRVAEALTPPRQPFFYDETPPAPQAGTSWRMDDALAQRRAGDLPALPSVTSDTDLSPTELRVAVNPDGSVEHVLVEQSSGGLGAAIGKDLDQQAVLAARKIRFKPTDNAGLLWGRMTVFWRYSAKPREVVVPTPPTAPEGG